MFVAMKNKLSQSSCQHDWHVIGCADSVNIWLENERKTLLYCPICDKNLKIKEDKARQIIKKQEIRQRYSK